ncbi:hypothetical protein G7Y89_g5215 [Cudoniella acicularis]|uniref:Heterokaryon incompatibility domain-containing protein n=1 Tax=Cudoniella acicularis TaxID=354080 RepID=A0A8H4RQ50_9HELO|nr:hypothetical protein G7Y89_g5215 [Cudoniella acicularis]
MASATALIGNIVDMLIGLKYARTLKRLPVEVEYPDSSPPGQPFKGFSILPPEYSLSQTDDVGRFGFTEFYSREHYLLASKRSFRLLALSNSRSEDDLLQCSLQSYKLVDGQHPQYTALSYMWRDSRRCVPIVLNGVKFYITSNLLKSLEHLKDIQQRYPNISGRWWIDMLCINQDDDRERGHQVGIMRDIYQRVNLVVAWLGPETGGSRDLMQGLDRQLL